MHRSKMPRLSYFDSDAMELDNDAVQVPRVGSIEDLSYELIALIFKFTVPYVEDMYFTWCKDIPSLKLPWTLAQVCKTWRVIAHSTRCIWQCCDLGRENAHPEIISRFFELAGAGAPQIHYTLPTPPSTRIYAHLKLMLNYLDKYNSLRLFSTHVDITNTGVVNDFRNAPEPKALKRFSITLERDDRDSDDFMLKWALSIIEKSELLMSLDATLYLPPPYNFTWPKGLQFVTLDIEGGLTVATIIRILSQCAFLEELTANLVERGSDLQPDDKRAIADFRSEELCFGDLRSLNLQGPQSLAVLLAIYDCIFAPALDCMVINSIPSDDKFRLSFAQVLNMAPNDVIDLHLNLTNIPTVVELLGYMDHCKLRQSLYGLKLECEPAQLRIVTTPFLEALAKRRDADGNLDTLPSLQELKFFHCLNVPDGALAEFVIKRLAVTYTEGTFSTEDRLDLTVCTSGIDPAASFPTDWELLNELADRKEIRMYSPSDTIFKFVWMDETTEDPTSIKYIRSPAFNIYTLISFCEKHWPGQALMV